MRTVTLEFLRHGPPHNQLLSPLTQYMALCGNHSGTTVRIPFEHRQVLMRLRAFGYKDSDETRKLQLEDTARTMSEVLAQVPGLIAELAESPACPEASLRRAKEETERGGTPLAHLRLILSASELALLPFELATSPNGFPGAGQPMALQAQLPLCVTREVRRVTNEQFEWPKEPRILFIAAGDVPFERHLDALRDVIDPWVRYFDKRTFQKRIEEHLVILPEANVDQIQAACATGDFFTHVHILAHGMQVPGAKDERFGIALCDPRDPHKPDVVEGDRLAALLQTSGPGGAARSPAVVTLASCESAAQGSVVVPGSSVAHALHEAGIPLVIGSQFPLSLSASVLLVEVLYKELLWGTDPRKLLWDLRRQLKSRVPQTHDWASLVVYAAFPSSLEDQLDKVKLGQAQDCINAAMDRADYEIGFMSAKVKKQRAPGVSAIEAMDLARRKILVAKKHLEEIHARNREEKAILCGLRASTEKREAEMLFRTTREADRARGFTSKKLEPYLDAEECVRRARNYYRKGFEADPGASWALVQFMVLDAVLRAPDHQIRPDLWITARTLANQDLRHDDQQQVDWAHGSLIELYLLALLMPPGPGIPEAEQARRTSREHAQELSRSTNRLTIHTTSRQILRYVEWFFLDLPDPDLSALTAAAEEVYDILDQALKLPQPA